MNQIPSRIFALPFLLTAGVLGWRVPHALAAPAVSAEAYRGRLQYVAAQLRRMENAPRRRISPILGNLTKTEKVRRADGTTQTIQGDEWQRRATEASPNATREQVRGALAAVEMRRRALDEWMTPRDGQFYEPADAQTIMGQLESTGQIRTGPTQSEQMWSDFKDAIGNFFRKLFDWIGGLFSPPSGAIPTPKAIDPDVVRAIFYCSILALLSVVGYFLWRVIGPVPGWRRGRGGARRDVRFLGGEDAELLKLPPDELRERARQLARNGEFPEALRHLYISLLLHLDARGVWRYDTRRTNWEHIAGLRGQTAHAPFVQPLSDLTLRFDRVRYGNAACTHDDWTRFEQDVEGVEKIESPGAGEGHPNS